MRVEKVVNSPTDFGVQRRLHNLAELVEKAKGANRRLLELQHAGQGCIPRLNWILVVRPSVWVRPSGFQPETCGLRVRRPAGS
jgi:hypothetical protein